MPKRPTPNRRRGLLRAAAAVVTLVIVLVVAVLIVSSLTASPAQAPTPPPTPGPIRRGPPTVAPKPTTGHKKKTGLLLHVSHDTRPLYSQGFTQPSAVYRKALQFRSAVRTGEVSDPRGQPRAYFESRGDAYANSPLLVAFPHSHRPVQVGYGDAFARPVWKPDGSELLYVKVQRSTAFPGARWSLVDVNLRTRQNTVLYQINALNLTPLGWSQKTILFLVANTTDTSIYRVHSGKVTFLTIMMPQTLVTASLSPSGRYIAFAAPANCRYCTFDIYDLNTMMVWSGPSGMGNETSLAWTGDSRSLVFQLAHRLNLVSVGPFSVIDGIPLPAQLPEVWVNQMQAIVRGNTVGLKDMVTSRTFWTYRSH